MQERYETEKTLLRREMEEMNTLLAERQRLLESKADQLERKKQELVSLIRSRLLKKIYGIDGKASDFDKRIMLMY